MRPVRSIAALAALLLAVGLAASRLGLVWHELVGHGGTALAEGGDLLEVQLFWFAGGWIRYRVPDAGVGPYVAIALGGIVVELIAGLALWFAIRRTTLGWRIVRAVGAAFAIHAAWYLAVGTWHGYGDGVLLRRELPFEARLAIALGGGALAVGLGYFGARASFGALLATLPSHRLAGLAIAAVVAAGIQVGLVAAELQLRRDPTYGQIMQPERERIVARELAQWTEDQARRGAAIDLAARRARARELAEQHRDWPFAYVLGAAVLAAVIAGALRSPRPADAAIPARLLRRTAALAAGSIALVIALDALLGL